MQKFSQKSLLKFKMVLRFMGNTFSNRLDVTTLRETRAAAIVLRFWERQFIAIFLLDYVLVVKAAGIDVNRAE